MNEKDMREIMRKYWRTKQKTYYYSHPEYKKKLIQQKKEKLEKLKKDPEAYRKYRERENQKVRDRKKPKRYEKSKYPSIFKGVYWFNPLYEEKDQDIIDNRDQFIEEFGIHSKKRLCKKTSKIFDELPRWFDDHRELYWTHKKNIVLLVSPYHSLTDENCNKIPDGWFKIDKKLYDGGATTFAKLILKAYL